MKLFGDLSIRRRIAIAVCAVFACIALALGFFAPNFARNSYADGEAVPSASLPKVASAQPLRDYTSITAKLYDTAAGHVLVYGGRTSAKDLKENLIVEGVYGGASYVLSPEEYTLTRITLMGDTEVSAEITDETAPLLSEIDDEADLPDISVVVHTLVRNASTGAEQDIASSRIALTAAATSAYPEYSNIAATDLNGISNDYSENTIKNAPGFQVTDGKGPIYNREFYTVTKVEMPSVGVIGDEGFYTVALTSDPAVTAQGRITNVENAVLLNATLEIKWTERDSTGRYYITDDGYSAFVAGMSQKEIFAGLILTAHYRNSSREVGLLFSDSGTLQTATNTGETVNWNGGAPSLDVANDSLVISLTVARQSTNPQTQYVSVSIPLESSKVVSIAVEDGFEYSGETLYPYSEVPTSIFGSGESGKITATLNSGQTRKLNSNEYEITDNLAPIAEDFVKSTYNKVIKVKYVENSEITADFSFPVTNATITSVERNRNDSFVTQYYRKPFNLDGRTVGIIYDDDDNKYVSVPLIDLQDEKETYVQVILKDAGGVALEDQKILSTEVKSVEIRFRSSSDKAWQVTYTGSVSENNGSTGFRLLKLDLLNPSLSTSVVDYSEALHTEGKPFAFADDLDEATKGNLDVSVYATEACMDAEPQQTVTNEDGDELARIENGAVKFYAGGTYYVRFRIGEADFSEVQWAQPAVSAISRSTDGRTLVYKIEINKGPISLRVEYENEAAQTWQYGQFNAPKVIGTPLGTSQDFELNPDEYKLDYYRASDGDVSGYPVNVGLYYVVARTKESPAYQAAVSPLPLSGAPGITVIPAELDIAKVESVIYDAGVHPVSDFIQAIGFISDGVHYTDTPEDVLKLPSTGYTDVTKETVSLTIRSDNYVWKGEDATQKTKSVEIEITQRQLGLKISNAGNLGFVYGGEDVSGNSIPLPKPVLQYHDNYSDENTNKESEWLNEKDALFFAQEGSAEYYLATDYNKTTNAATGQPKVAADFEAWDAGAYVVVFRTSKDEVTYGSGNYTLPVAVADFTVAKKAISKVEYTQTSEEIDTYDGNLHGFHIDNWTNQFDNSGDEAQENYILTYEFTAKYFDREGNVTQTDMAVETLTGVTAVLGNKIPLDASPADTTGNFGVMHAGEYTVTVHLNPNYCWAGESGAAEDVTVTYTLKQKPFQGNMGSWQPGDDFTWDRNVFTYIPDSEQDVPEITMTGLAGGAQKITFVLELWQLTDGGEKVIVGDGTGRPETSGTYFYKLTGWTGMSSGGHDSAYDFTFPSDEFIIEFTINSAALKAPVVDIGSLEIEYDGTAHKFTDYIGNWSIPADGFQFTYGANNAESKVYVYVQSAAGNSGEAVGGHLAQMTDAGTYTVYIYPKSNFKWEDDIGAETIRVNGEEHEGFSYPFTITPKKLTAGDFKWYADTDTGYVAELPAGDYNGYVYNNVSRGLLVVANVEGRDGAVTVEYHYNVADRKNAGTRYTATVDGLTEGSGNWFNYSVDSGITKSFTIQRLGVTKATVSAGSSAFDGSDHTATFGLPTISVIDLNWDNVASASVTGVYGFTGAGNASNGMTNVSVLLSSGSFKYTNAGTYTVTFTITDTTNYYWIDGENEAESYAASFTVERMEITAPSLGEQSGGQYISDRTMQYDGGEKLPKLDRDSAYSMSGGNLVYTVDSHAVTFSVFYGLYGGGFDYITSSVSPINYNKYYVQLKITSGNPLNYVLIRNDADIRADSTNMGVFEQNGYEWGEVSYAVNGKGVSVYLAYMITKQILDVDFSLLGNQSFYKFGDNGLVSKVQEATFIKLTQGADLETVQKDIGDGKATVSKAFYSVADLDVLIANGVDPDKLIDPADLVKGLPWNAGTYGVRIEIRFTDENAQYEPIVRWYTFEVKKLEMSVTWSAGDSAVTGSGTDFTAIYDGQSHTLTAAIGNAPKKDADDEPNPPVLTVSGGDRTNANESGYTLSVTGTYENYTAAGGTNTSATLTIERRTVTVNVKTDKVTHVYSGGAAYPENYYTYASTNPETHFVETDRQYITYVLCAVDDDTHTPIQTYRVGTYCLVPVLDSAVVGSSNYRLGDCGTGTLEIVAREIEVSLLATAKSDYRQTKVTLTEGVTYEVTLKNSTDENWLVSGDSKDSIFTVASGATANEWQKAGSYPVNLTKVVSTVGGNYVVLIKRAVVYGGDTASLGDYVIEKVALQSVSATGKTDVVYNGQDRTWIGELIDASATAQNQTENLVAWKYVLKSEYPSAPDKDSSLWAEFATPAHNAFEATDYWVMATAPNHLNAEPISVTVSIAKEQLNVTVNFTGDHALYYGQSKPDGSVTVADGKLPVNSIYAVSGFKGNDGAVWEADGTIEGLTGTFSYTTSMAGGNKNPVGTDYTTAFVPGTLESVNYTFAPTAEGGSLTVKQLPVTVTIASQSRVYMYMTQTGFVLEDESVLQDYFTIESTVEGITVPNTKAEILSLKTGALILENDSITATADAGKYALYAVSNGAYGNYDCTFVITGETWSGSNPEDNGFVGTAGTFEITDAENAFVGHFAFASAAVGETDSVADTAWTYGLKTAGNENGYDSAVRHAITKPATKFNSMPGSSALNTIVYELLYKDGGSWVSLGKDTDVDALFASVLKKGEFIAGTYRISYTMAENGNYGAASGARYFKIGQKSLTVTAATVEVYYGESASVGFNYSGLVDNGCGTADAIGEVLTVETATSYKVGNGVGKGELTGGKYETTAALKAQQSKYANYTVTYVPGALTVKPRPVTVTIDAKSSQYDFNAASGRANETNGKALTFTAALGTAESGLTLTGNPFYQTEIVGNLTASSSYNNDNQSVVALSTNALTPDATIKTQNVGNYPIFASYKNVTVQSNYAVTVATAYERDEAAEAEVKEYFHKGEAGWSFYTVFVENYYNGLGSLAIGGNGTYYAGVYKITKANLALNQSALSYRNADGSYTEYEKVSEGLIYDGKVKGYTATPSGENYASEQITAVYLLRGSADGDWTATPKDVGTYDYQFEVTNPNYMWEAPGSYAPLIIEQRTLTASVSVAAEGLQDAPARAANYNSTQYYYRGAGNAYTLSYTFGNFIGSEPLVLSAHGAEAAKADGTQSAFNAASFNPFTTVTSTYSGYVYTLTAQNAGKYTVTLTLDPTAMKNYTFGTGADVNQGSIVFTFYLNRASFNVVAGSSSVQYGSPINANGTRDGRFGGFSLANIDALKAAENNALTGSFNTGKVTYFVNGYSDGSNGEPSGAGAKFTIGVNTGTIESYNYHFTNTSGVNDAVLTVLPRSITVVLNGSNNGNPAATRVYDGSTTGPDATDNRYFTPRNVSSSDTWAGNSGDDAKVANRTAYATLFGVSQLTVLEGSVLDARDYHIYINRGGASNYAVTFISVSGTGEYEINSDIASALRPVYKVEQALLTVYAGSRGMNGDDSALIMTDSSVPESFRNFEITYGNVIGNYFTVRYSGWVNNEGNELGYTGDASKMKGILQFSTQLQSGSGAYTAWESHAGEKYTVTPFGLSFTNYQVVDEKGASAWIPATMTVVSRLVTAETADRTYTEWIDSNSNTIDYRSGGEGAYHAAQIVFKDSAIALINNPKTYYTLENGAVRKDVFGVIADEDIFAYAPNRSMDTLGYAYQTSANVPLGSAPRKAGSYYVTVPMKVNGSGAYDYKIVTNGSAEGATSVTLEYSVLKKSLSLSWDSRNPTADGRDYMLYDEKMDGTSKTMSVTRVTDEYGRESGFIGDIMSINIAYRNEVQEEIREGSTLGEKLYTRTNHKFEICIYAAGEYNVFVALTTTASENYEWRGGSVSMEQLYVVFSTKGFAITSLTIGTDGRWTYDPTATAPSPKYTLSNGIPVTSITLEFSYAPITLPAGFNANEIGKLIDINRWNESDFGPGAASANVPTLAGTYLLKAHYPRTDLACSDAYCVFVIERKEVTRPRIEAADAVFNDGDRILKLTYNVSLFECLYGGTTQTLLENGNPVGIIVTQFDQGTYNVSFRINPDVTANYTLTDLADTTAEGFGNVRYEISGNTVTFVWTVAPATDHTVSLSDTSMLENLVYGRSYSDPSATASYHGSIRIEYLADGVWTTERPIAAKTYKVRAVSPATDNYYAEAPGRAAVSDVFEFTIARATLTVTPYGTAVYGVPFNAAGGAGYEPVYSGFCWDDDESVVSGSATYRFATVPAHLNVNAEGYALTLVTDVESGFVTGLSADNYNIVVETGRFTVTPKNISVIVGEISATYGDEVDLTHFTATAWSPMPGDSALEYGEEIGVLGITLSFRGNEPEGGMKRTVGVYQLDAEWDNGNYNVTFLSHGLYVVSAMDIRIEIEAGGGTYGGNIVGATVTSIVKVTAGPGGEEQTESIVGRADIRVPQFTFGYYGTANDSAAWNYDYLNVQTAMPTLAGNYTAIAQGTETNNFNLLNSPSVAFVIARQEIDGSLITTQDGVYTGSELTPVINENGYEELYTPAFGSYVNAGTYEVMLTLNDPANYKWASVDIPERTISFRIVKGELVFTTGEEDQEVAIEGWTFGETAKAPSTQTQLGGNEAGYVYYYSKTGDENGDDWTTTVPTAAGTWYVRVTVPQTENYNPKTSKPTQFVIEKAALKVPVLNLVTEEGEGKNDTYTGGQLQLVVSGFDNARTTIVYNYDEGYSTTADGDIVLRALNAGDYVVRFRISDPDNYRWGDGVRVDEDGNASLVWTVARKKVEMPTENKSTFIVNGGMLRYIPVGFDAEIMEISGNEISYGGSFTVTVKLKDTVNYMWADSRFGDDPLEFTWTVVGWDTIFVIVISSLGVVAGIAAIAIGIQYFLHKRKKRAEAEKEAAAAQAFQADVQSRVESNAKTAESENAAPAAEDAKQAGGEEPAEQPAEPQEAAKEAEKAADSGQEARTAEQNSEKKTGDD